MYKHLKKLFKSKNTIYVFDIDGVLSAFEYSENDARHNFCTEKQWANATSNAIVYPHARPLKTMQRFIKKNRKRCYVCSWETNPVFMKQKEDFVLKYYGITKDRVFFVKSNKEKLITLFYIKTNLHPSCSKKEICMVDDNIDVLSHIYNNSEFTTIHISSFLK